MTATLSRPTTPAQRICALRSKAISIGLTEGEESQMRLEAGAPQKNDAEFAALVAKCDAAAAAPLQTPSALQKYLQS
jgi:hypothetical protein